MFGKLIDRVTNKLDHILNSHAHTYYLTKNVIDRSLLLSGRIASQNLRHMGRIDTLADVEFRVTSQWGEDGIIEWLIQRLPDLPQSFIEFGVENYLESNTRFLLQNRGWQGLVLDGSDSNIRHVQSETLYWMHDLVAKPAFITAENINELITNSGFAGELGILSVDIDGNDYWVLKAIDCLNPAIMILEYNAVLGNQHAITVPYDPGFERLKAHYSGQYFGASIKAMTKLATDRGYTFVGTNSNGVNAFYVRNDLAGAVTDSIARIKEWPARHRDSRDLHGTLTFLRGLEKAEAIKTLPVYNIRDDVTQSIASLYPLYGEDWLEQF